MRSLILTQVILMTIGCGSVDHLASSIDNASKTNTSTATGTGTAQATSPVSTTQTVTSSNSSTTSNSTTTVTTTTSNGTSSNASSAASKAAAQDPLLGLWQTECDAGQMFQKEFKDGAEIDTMLSYSDNNCEKNSQKLYVIKKNYKLDGNYIVTGQTAGGIPRQLFKIENGEAKFCDTSCVDDNISESDKTFDESRIYARK